MNISYINSVGDLVDAFPPDLNLRVDNYLNGTVSHRRKLHRKLFGGFYVEADPAHWKGAFSFTCEDVTVRQITFLRAALTTTLTTGKAFLTFEDITLFGNYVPNTLIVTSSGRMTDLRRQRDVSFSFEGKLQI